jgi:hypothetical protein
MGPGFLVVEDPLVLFPLLPTTHQDFIKVVIHRNVYRFIRAPFTLPGPFCEGQRVEVHIFPPETKDLANPGK